MKEAWKVTRMMAELEFPDGFMASLSYGFIQVIILSFILQDDVTNWTKC